MPPGIYQHRRKTIAERFWAKVDKSGGPDACWPWTGYRNKGGYGHVGIDGHTIHAHRLAYILTYGPLPDGIEVCHNCPDGDNPACVNPGHMFLGTHADNMRDMQNKGRHPQGQGNYNAKLTEQDVLAIRATVAAGTEQVALAKIYGVSKSLVNRIVLRRAWRHI